MKKILLILGILSIISLNIDGKDLAKYKYPCHMFETSPAIDGSIEEMWSSAPWWNGFLIYTGGSGAKGYAVEMPTRFKAGWTKDALFLLIEAYDSEPEKLNIAKNTSAWSQNSVEILFSPRSDKNFVQLLTTASGTKWSGLSGTREVELDWDVKTGTSANSWIAEARIPFKTLGRIPKDGEIWAVNIARNSVTGTGVERYTCWPPLKNGFHDVPNFGKFVFLENNTDVSEKENLLNLKYKKFLVDKVKDICSVYSETKKYVVEGSKYPALSIEAEALNKALKDIEIIRSEDASSMETMTLFLMKRNDLKRIASDFKYRTQLEELLAQYSGDCGK